MRVKMIFAALAMVAMVAMSATAQAPPKPFDIYIGGGVSMPTGNFGDAYKMGFHGNGKIAFEATPMIDIVGNIAYHTFSFDDQGNSDFDGGSTSVIMIGGDGRYAFDMPQSNFGPYVLAGVGLGIVSLGDITLPVVGTVDGGSETKPYINFGGGAEVQKFFFEIKYVIVMTSGDSFSFLPITVGVKF